MKVGMIRLNRRGAETQRGKDFRVKCCAQRFGVRVTWHRFGMSRSGEAGDTLGKELTQMPSLEPKESAALSLCEIPKRNQNFALQRLRHNTKPFTLNQKESTYA